MTNPTPPADPTPAASPGLAARVGARLRRVPQRCARAGRRLVEMARSPSERWTLLSVLTALGLLAWAMGHLLGPMLEDWSTSGFHDWDVHAAYRYITVLSIRDFGELPWWHPWFCGGFPAFGLHGGVPNFVSPWLPLYLAFGDNVMHAVRVEIMLGFVIGSAGAWAVAGRFTRSVALKTLVVVLFMLNSRWTLQTAVGHSWHLEYAWFPWAFFFFDRALEPGRLRNAILAGAVIALMAFHGAIYPAPHAALAIGLYGLIIAAKTRSARPLLALLVVGVVAVGLAAPKLFALADSLSQAPRTIESSEAIGLRQLIPMMTSRAQRYGAAPIDTPAYNWHEWGLYVGVPGFFLLASALFVARGKKQQALRWVGLVFLLLGLGSIHALAPWSLLHELPVFSAMHVPSRFLYPMVLILALSFVALVARWVDWRVARQRWIDLALMLPVVAIGIDMAVVSRQSMEQAWWLEAPETIERAPLFEHYAKGDGVSYVRSDWAQPLLLPMFANKGVLECYGVPPTVKKGALAKDQPGYRGPAYIADGPGRAEVVEWSPNHALIRVTGAAPGALVVYNMNYDRSWDANGEPALDHADAVAGRLPPGGDTIEFSYLPRTLKLSVPIALLTLAACIGVPWWWRRRSRRRAT